MGDNEMHTVCRLCLSENEKLIYIFESKGKLGWTAADAIRELLRFQVSADDVYPHCVCMECLWKLEDFKLFKQRCESNKELLDREFSVKRGVGCIENAPPTIQGTPLAMKAMEEENSMDTIDNKQYSSPLSTTDNDVASDSEVNKSISSAQNTIFPFIWTSPILAKFSGKVLGLSKDFDSSGPSEIKFESPDTNTSSSEVKVESKGPYKKVKQNRRTPSSGGSTSEKPFICTECGSQFTHKGNLITHLRIHSGIKPFKCNECEREFTRSDALKQHAMIHSREKPFKCAECNEGFSRLDNLQKHERIHSGEKPFKCKECDKLFARGDALKQHEATHSDAKPYKCVECDRSFSLLGTLKKHEGIHSKEKLYKCKECGKGFSRCDSLKRHESVHSGESPYKCSVCNKGLSDSGALKKHLKTHSVEKQSE